jgi:hypothetical protein
MDATTEASALELFVQTMTERMAQLARSLGAWVQAEPRTLQEQEHQLLGQLHELGTALLSGLLALHTSAPASFLPCSCGARARFRRNRPATLTTLLGRLTYTRPTYGCDTCHQGFAPLDQQLQVAAGSFSLGLQELQALLGATQASFADAASVLARLSLVQVCPNSLRAATEDLGDTLVQHSHAAACAAQKQGVLPDAQSSVPTRLYISVDGVTVRCRNTWREIKTGCLYTTRTQRSRRAPFKRVERMEQASYSAKLSEAEPFGWQMLLEAARRGVEQAEEVIVIGDGAHWIWKLAEQHFPQATQIVDWYHASQYVWNAASSVYPDDEAARTGWVKQQLERLWEGRVEEVLAALSEQAGDEGAVDASISYYTTHRERLEYPSYRARGLQIGSGTIESTCKHLISARLKQAGMNWSEEGANAVSAVRGWLKSGRWAEAMGLRAVPRRCYRQSREGQGVVAEQAEQQQQVEEAAHLGALEWSKQETERERARQACERVRAEMAAEEKRHPWRYAWSVRQQRHQLDAA